MKILVLCKKFPFPLKDGESIAVHSLSRSLHELGNEVSLLAMNTSKHFFSHQEMPPEMNHYRRIRTVPIDNRIKPLDAFLNLFSHDSYHIKRYESSAYGIELQRMLQEEEYDVIQLETLYLAPYVPLIRSRNSSALVVMRAHNVEHEIWERVVRQHQPGPKRWYLQHLTGKLRDYERRQLNQYDLLAPITPRDLALFRSLGCTIPAVVTPIGLQADDYQPDPRSWQAEPSMSFIGSLDWMPNLEGLQWFLRDVWPEVQQRFPALSLHIAGRNTPSSLQKLQLTNVHVHGEVPDAAAFINAHNLMIVPLLSGSGMRAKILEGMALGKVVITTSLGLEGINARHKQEVMVANNNLQFMQALEYLLRKPHHLERIGRQAQDLVARQYDSLAIARRLQHAYSTTTVAAV